MNPPRQFDRRSFVIGSALTTFPDAGHFVQQDAADLVTRTMRAWLER
jgi:pimeloyl-ACP methyl ester carboxylesterase